MSDLLSFIISNIVKNEFSSMWNWISCCNDVMNHIDCVIKRLPTHTENAFMFLKYIMGNIAWIIA